MATHSPIRGSAAELTDRRSERDVLDRLTEAVRAGESLALVVRGEPGVGKTVLLDYLVEHASGFRVARAAGVQSEMELAFAGLHQLLAPMLDRLETQASARMRRTHGVAWSQPSRGGAGAVGSSTIPTVCCSDFDRLWKAGR